MTCFLITYSVDCVRRWLALLGGEKSLEVGRILRGPVSIIPSMVWVKVK